MKKLYLMILFCFSFNCSGGNVNEFNFDLPEQSGKWKVTEEDKIYDRETLYSYMNGGAELFLAFDYQNVLVRRYVLDDENEIVLDIYNMKKSSEAFGIFSTDIEDDEANIGQGSEFGGGMLRFWKGKYFVSIVSMGVDDSVDEAILDIGRKTADAIKATGDKPEILDMLPEKNLINRTTSFFHSDVNLNNRFYLASDNILNLSKTTDCAFAEYKAEESVFYLLVITYPDQASTDTAFNRFIESYMPDAKDTGIIRTEDGNWTWAVRIGNHIKIVFEAPSKESAAELILEK